MSVPEWSGPIGTARDRVLWQMVPRTQYRSGEGPALSDIPAGSDREGRLRDRLFPHPHQLQQLSLAAVAEGRLQHTAVQIQEEPEGILHRPSHVLDQDDDLVVHDVHGAGHQDQGPLAAGRRTSVLGHRQGPARDSRLHHRVRYGDKRHSLLPTRHQHFVAGVLKEALLLLPRIATFSIINVRLHSNIPSHFKIRDRCSSPLNTPLFSSRASIFTHSSSQKILNVSTSFFIVVCNVMILSKNKTKKQNNETLLF